jgi:hypothetical protein
MVMKPIVFRMETHCPGDFWDGLRGFAHLLHCILLLSASKPGNAIIFSSEYFWGRFSHIGPNGKTPQNQIPLNLGYILSFAH